MDSGFLVEGDTLYDTYDVGKPLLPEEVIGIMDQLLCHEVSHLDLLLYIFLVSDILISPLDGMANGTSIVSNCIHKSLH